MSFDQDRRTSSHTAWAPRPRYCFLATAALLGALALPADAVAADRDHPLLDRFGFTAGSFFTSVNTELRLDGSPLDLGDRIDFESTFGLGDQETLLRLSGNVRLGNRHQIGLGYFDLSRQGTRVLEEELEFGGITFPVDIETTAFVNTEYLAITYTYWAWIKDRWVLGFSFGAVDFSVETGVEVAFGRVGVGPLGRTASTDLPVPLVGAEVRLLLAPKLMFRANGGFVSVGGIEDYSGSVFDLTAALEHRTFEHLGFGLAFNAFEIDLEVEKRSFLGDIDYRISGLQLFGRIRF